jgi:hypothetical protein
VSHSTPEEGAQTGDSPDFTRIARGDGRAIGHGMRVIWVQLQHLAMTLLREARGGSFTKYLYNANDFTASAGTWTVSSANVNALQYTIYRHQMTLMFDLVDTSVSNAGVVLRLALPRGYVIHAKTTAICRVGNNGTLTVGLVVANPDLTYLEFRADPTAAGFAISASNTFLQGQIIIEVATFIAGLPE